MIGLLYSNLDPASKNIAEHIKSEYQFEPKSRGGKEFWGNGEIQIHRSTSELIFADHVDELNLDLIYFLNKHSSAEGVASFTTHSTGNWTNEAKLGGEPKQLSRSAPIQMRAVLESISKIDATGLEKTYEATHHGPVIKTPSMFVELGGTKDAINDKHLAAKLADAVYSSIIDKNKAYKKIAIGIGGIHYSRKFSRLAIEEGYAFSYIMPKYAIMNEDESDNLEMLEQALQRSKEKPEIAVIEWKSINSDVRNRVIKKLNAIGLEYERT